MKGEKNLVLPKSKANRAKRSAMEKGSKAIYRERDCPRKEEKSGGKKPHAPIKGKKPLRQPSTGEVIEKKWAIVAPQRKPRSLEGRKGGLGTL